MDFFIVGRGKHVEKKIIPSLKSLDRQISAYFTNFSTGIDHLGVESIPRSKWSDYVSSLTDEQKLSPLLIATPPSIHLRNIVELSELGFSNFIVEKPLVTNTADLKALRKIRGIDIQLINMFEFSPSWDFFLKDLETLIATYPSDVLTMHFEFIIPDSAIPHDDFRRLLVEGGALCDVGYYPLSAAYLVSSKLGLLPIISCHKVKKNHHQAPFFGEFVINENSLINITGTWGLSDNYRNQVTVTVGGLQQTYSFIFSKPQLGLAKVYFKQDNVVSEQAINEHMDQYAINLVAAINRIGRSVNDKLCDFLVSEFDDILLK